MVLEDTQRADISWYDEDKHIIHYAIMLTSVGSGYEITFEYNYLTTFIRPPNTSNKLGDNSPCEMLHSDWTVAAEFMVYVLNPTFGYQNTIWFHLT